MNWAVLKPAHGNTISLSAPCHMCRQRHTVTGDTPAVKRWMAGESYVQDLFPEMSADDREFLITQTCGVCWNKMMGGEDNDDI